MTNGEPLTTPISSDEGLISVFVVDDEVDLLELMQARLSRRGFQVMTANSLNEACSKLEGFRPRIVICDIHLGNESGIDVLRHCSSLGLEIPFVFLSGAESFDTYRAEVGQEVQCEFVHKPVDFNELLEIVRNLLVKV